MDGQVLTTTLPRERLGVLASLLRQPDRVHEVRIGAEDYVVLARPLTGAGDARLAGHRPGRADPALAHRAAGRPAGHPDRPGRHGDRRGDARRRCSASRSRAPSRGPLAAITGVMREVAATGDLTRKIALLRSHRWDDEDARLLATTFNTLTDSIARFQREMSQKERLSSLGRLSTVIAHEIRNPLMIIKASLHAPPPAGRHRRDAARSGRRHRRRGGAAQPHRERGPRLRPADSFRAGAGRSERALPGVGGRRPGVGPRAGRSTWCCSGRCRRSRPMPSGCGSRWSTCW